MTEGVVGGLRKIESSSRVAKNAAQNLGTLSRVTNPRLGNVFKLFTDQGASDTNFSQNNSH